MSLEFLRKIATFNAIFFLRQITKNMAITTNREKKTLFISISLYQNTKTSRAKAPPSAARRSEIRNKIFRKIISLGQDIQLTVIVTHSQRITSCANSHVRNTIDACIYSVCRQIASDISGNYASGGSDWSQSTRRPKQST